MLSQSLLTQILETFIAFIIFVIGDTAKRSGVMSKITVNAQGNIRVKIKDIILKLKDPRNRRDTVDQPMPSDGLNQSYRYI